jgi:uncharacterized protein
MRRVLLVCLLVASCAAPPLTLYTLGTAPAQTDASTLGQTPPVVAVARVTMPDELDTADVVVRDGNTLRRSSGGRWASRLSLGITDRLTAKLAQRYPGLLVTDRPLTDAPAARVLVNISRIDTSASGTATLEADWVVAPHDPGRPIQRDRMRTSISGPVGTDQDVVRLTGELVDRLAAAIDLSGFR